MMMLIMITKITMLIIMIIVVRVKNVFLIMILIITTITKMKTTIVKLWYKNSLFFSSPYPYVKFNCKDYILLTEKAAYIVWYLNLKILCTAHLLFECGEPRRRKKSNNNSKVIILAFSAPKNYVHQLIKVVFWQFCFFKN